MGKHMLIACAVGDLQWLKLCVDKGGDPTFINHEVRKLESSQDWRNAREFV